MLNNAGMPGLNADLPPAIFLMGPTASGKTAATVALYQHFPVEIISVDSALVYRDMDIGTAKPDAQLLAQAPHHLINLISPLEQYSAARFVQDALALMQQATARGRIPLLVGGTMLYFNALQHGLSNLPPANTEIRQQIEAEAAAKGWPALHAELAQIDPEVAAGIQPNDTQRIERALEVYRISGLSMTQLRQQSSKHALPYRILKVALLPGERAVLHQRIAERFKLMLNQGLVEEVRGLLQRYPELHEDMPSMRCVGYRQTLHYLSGKIDLQTLEAHGVYATRQLAKRQLTWLRGMTDTYPLDCIQPDWLHAMLKTIQQFESL